MINDHAAIFLPILRCLSIEVMRLSISFSNRRFAMRTFITALLLFFALVSGISMIVLAFRADFQELAADNGGDRAAWELPRPNSK